MLGLLFFAEQYIEIPRYLQPIGRMHPLLLHFPIVLFILIAFVEVYKKSIGSVGYKRMLPYLTFATALTSLISALMGLFLSQESSYAGDGISTHKWYGIGLTFLSLILFNSSLKKQESSLHTLLYIGALVLSIPVLIIGSHKGANITHGKNFILGPINTDAANESLTGEVYTDHIFPIFKRKCINCHNDDKTKGGFNMTSIYSLIKGGETGLAVVKGSADESELVHRINLPIDDEEHMPPEGKRQLTADEIDLIIAWIDEGAERTLKTVEVNPQSDLFDLLKEQSESKQVNQYSFKAAKQKVLASINGPFVNARPLFANSPALEVDLFVRKTYTPELLESLKPVREQTVQLNLSGLPIKDDDLNFIATFPNLEKLILNGTDITGNNLQALHQNTKLRTLAIASTSVGPKHVIKLKDHPALLDVYVWDTSLNGEDMEDLKSKLPHINLHAGVMAESQPPIPLSPPILKNKKEIVGSDEDIVLEHKMNGVQIVYTLDGSEPDESSEIFTHPIRINQYTQIKSISIKEGWLPSEVVTHDFYVKGKSFENLKLLTKPNQKFPGNGALTINDFEKGEINKFGNKKWLGYQDNPFSTLLDLGADFDPASQIILSYGVNMGSYIMAPTRVEVYGGESLKNMKRIKIQYLPRAQDYIPNAEVALPLDLVKNSYRYLQVIAYPLRRLPKWHTGAGAKGWLFIDEIFVY